MSDPKTALTVRSKADPSSYAFDVPSWEPTIDELVTNDGENLTQSLGTRVVRRSDTKAAIATVGMAYTLLPHAALAKILDDVTAPFGGRAMVGPAKVHAGALFAASVKLPDSVGALLSVGVKDHSKRAAGITLRASHNGTKEVSLSLWAMRLACSNGAVAPGALLQASRKHTAGVVWLPQEIAGYAQRLPHEIEGYGKQLAKWSEYRMDRRVLESVVDDITGKSIKTTHKLIDMVLAADGTYVPAIDDQPGVYTALQVFEAATAYDRHVRTVRDDGKDPGVVRLNRLLDGNTLGAKAWDVLSVLKDF